ncbi:DNA repair protein RecO [Streptococcus agalactiae LMG 14747]|uniref:DNA repair protein RecO n=2 Tax=Streptococcus TaxID=1301 RepID=V6Z4D1_STRAG|nr:DNA repair protein RecO [Streptococcus acidominimus]ESV55747.1 DNA repair protein RecO [Streptococcus agalactiae LMG 14747]SNV31661.1 DNA recombination and repair protein RecO [Streptococcus acidominimus]
MINKVSQGIVLYNRDYRESDKLVKIFTETDGKRMFFVKHARKSKLTSVIHPLTMAEFLVKINDNGLSYIDDYSEVNYPKHITDDLFKLAYATYIMALADAAIPDNQPDSALFAFLEKVLSLIEEGLDYEVLTLIFEVQLLHRFGVSLNFHECVFCHRVGLPFDFSFRYAGILCPDHYHEDERRLRLDPNVLYLIDRFHSLSFQDLKHISIKSEMTRKLRDFVDILYEEYVGLHLKSKKFIDDLGKWGDVMK